jgi:hypothetical protein
MSSRRHNLATGLLLAVVVGLLFYSAVTCEKPPTAKIGKSDTVYVQGDTVVRWETRKDSGSVRRKLKPEIRYVIKFASDSVPNPDTVHTYHLSADTFTYEGITIGIRDSAANDSVYRLIGIVDIDSTKILTRIDTLRISRTDTVFVQPKLKGWKVAAWAIAVGFLLGVWVR